MATVTGSRVRGRPAHFPGPTFLAYTPNGNRLITAGSNNFIRNYETGSSGDPVNVDDCQENNFAVAATNDFFLAGSEDGMVTMYSLETSQYERMLIRCTLPIRDIALSPDGQWAAVASDELTVKVVSTKDPENKYFYIRDLYKPAKHVTYDPSGSYLTISCSDGVVYIYKLSTEEPQLVRKIEDVVKPLETDSEISSRAVWHPDGRAFAVPTPLREIQVVSFSDGAKQRMFAGEHTGDITALAWSPNGAMLLTAGTDRKMVLWDTATQKALAKYDYANVTNIVWHPHKNLVSFTTADGEVFIYQDFVPQQHVPLLEHTLVRSPFIHDPLSEISGNARKVLTNGTKAAEPQRRRQRTPDPLDDILGPDADDADEDDFVVDDDGAGYAINGNGKRTNGHLEEADSDYKRRAIWEPSIHAAFQPGSTPWRGNRRYLCLNLIGFVWTVDQDASHHTVTVEFYDREFQRDFHFTDAYLYDKACLNEHGTLFSCQGSNENPSSIYYRPHETWTARPDWKIKLPPGEAVTSIALSESYVVATTSANYVRVYTLFGIPFRIFRSKSTPAVTCAAWRDYVLTMGNGPVGPDGSAKLLYTIENVRRDDVCQSEDVVALPENGDIHTVFFSDNGDPCIYDSDGVLLVLQHWRTPGQARWVPLLDTRLLERLASGRKEETYWPVAVAQDKFHCIILKGGDKYPYFPRPLLTEFDFQIPISSLSSKKKPSADEMDEDEEENAVLANEGPRLEETYVRHTILHSLAADLLENTHASHAQRAELTAREIEIDKSLLQLLNVECREGEERGMKALEIAGLLRDSTGSGKMLEAARKIAERYDRQQLVGKIEDLANQRLTEGMEDL